jgi:hypothetical protein
MFMAPLLAAVGPEVITGISMAGTVLDTVSKVKQGNYQAGLLQKQAIRDSYVGQIAAQDTGLNNAQEKAQVVLQQAASGFSVSSGSFAQRRAMLTVLSNRDQNNLVTDGQAKAAVDVANANTAKRSALDSMISGIFGIGTDLISGANLVAQQNVFNTNETARNVSAYGG